ncbi:phytoene dehydrogenase, chloroplastic/chromoplastic-like [Iris pallida]|uniref:Phytoene dehydrogenase, chloroplastic/chromoplastic-like n=1 Tax=Iris pallida TaxID=29817 RepID=A0AAX6GZ83_IRIPA|nr:phytoene dehydrogenase, chloroplastic/chromoplastic-like [Iris pallida]
MWWAAHSASPSPWVLTTRSTLPIAHERYRCRAEALPPHSHQQEEEEKKKKVVIVGAGWAGLASAHHLCKQGFDVTLLEAESSPAEEVGTRGFWYPYKNIFSIIDELGIQPFTKWTRSALYTSEGLEVEFPIFQDLPRLPTPFGALLYPQFLHLPLVDRLTSVPLIAPIIDFDNTDIAWRKYDAMTARELFKRFGCSERLYHECFEPLLQVSLFAPGEQCSAAATLGMLYYYILSHQQNYDVRWCRGTVREKIFIPWLESIKTKGCKFLGNQRLTDLVIDEDSGCILGVVCGKEVYEADAVVLAVGVSSLQSTIMNSSVLQSRQEFLNVLNLSAIDTVSVKIWLDRKVDVPKAINVCAGLDDLTGWTFFDLNSIYDEYEDAPGTVLEAEFYFAKQLLLLKDEQIVSKLMSYLSTYVEEFEKAIVLQQIVVKLPKSATHFFPGSYKYMMRGSTTIPNLYLAGDWIITRHGSWSKEKAYVTGLEAANRVVDYFGEGDFAKIIPVEEEEPHIETLRELNRRVNEIMPVPPISLF